MKRLICLMLAALLLPCVFPCALAEAAQAPLSPEEDSSDFVLLSEAVPDAILEIRYYSTYNFVGDRIDGYEEPVALLTREAAEALRQVSDRVVAQGYRLKIFDAYRPQSAVTHFVNWAQDASDTRMKAYFYPDLDKKSLIPQGYIAKRSGHSRGSTVDLTLFDMAAEKEVDMGGPFDFFGQRSHPDYTGITAEQYANRMLLREAMLACGFRPLSTEWWHFTLADEPFPDTYFTFPVNSASVEGNTFDEAALSAGDLSAILARGTLRVGVTGDCPPLSCRDSNTGEYRGFEAALAEDLAASLGVALEYVPTTWSTLMEDALAGRFDLALCGVTITEARLREALMSHGYLGSGKTLLCRAEEADRYTGLEAINRPEVRLAARSGGADEQFAREYLPEATLILCDEGTELPGLVAEGTVDAMIAEVAEAAWYAAQDSRLAAPLIDAPFTPGQIGALMQKGSDELLEYVNGFVETERASGRLDALAAEYIHLSADDALTPAA